MLQSWRWYGPDDPVLLDHVRQAGATGVVTALHDIYDGQVWTAQAISKRKCLIEERELTWSVVESIPVHRAIKLGTADASHYIDCYAETIRNLAAAGIHTICYNFMPVVDWTRTDLRFALPNGGLALRFDAIDFAAYDLHVLGRDDAHGDYDEDIASKARLRVEQWSDDTVDVLERTIIAGLPGSEFSHDRDGIRDRIADYAGFDADRLRGNLIAFLEAVVPVAESVGARLGIHPDDPPFSLFGLPRIVSCADDFRAIFSAVPSLANGMTFCSGSLGARGDNDLTAMARAFADRIHFAHLRNVRRQENGSFFESDHLDGDVDMVALVAVLLEEERRRKAVGRMDWNIPMRPDHGHLLLDDIHKTTNPGYSAIGRLKGLAELRGVIRALEAQHG
ncbi:MAG: mannonate dehydratase [Alphaproteobacteria bacterium]|nr:mannonate dehydratase [Alphaproteobacteria bacterium]